MKKRIKTKNQAKRAKRQNNNGERYHNSSLNLSSLQELSKEVATQNKIDEAVTKLGFEAFDYKVRIPGGWVCIPKGKATPELREMLHALVAELEVDSHE